MTHLPLTPGHYTTADGPVEVVYIGKSGKWAYDTYGNKWRVTSGKDYWGSSARHITGWVDPYPVEMQVPHGHWYTVGPYDAAMQSDIARVKADRDEAVELLRDRPPPGSFPVSFDAWDGKRLTFLAKFGGK